MEFSLHYIDIGIIILYFVLTLLVGFAVSRRASKNMDSYFLGGKSLPWWVLGISNASGMFDITGTMWLVYIGFVYGLKSAWLPWVWPMFNQIFLMVYLAIWLRRSNVMTGAEWIICRFGKTRGANLAHMSVVVFALISMIGFIAYDFKGIGKFAAIFLPWDFSPDTYALFFIGITTLYAVKGGMLSVVLTEILQFTIMTIASFAVGIIAMTKVSPEMLRKVTPDGWENLLFGWSLNLDWSGILDSANVKIAADGYSLFTIFFMLMMFKGILVSMAGPAPNYDMQRILATRSPKEAGLMSGFVNVALFFPRYMMVAGFTVLALVYFMPELQTMGENPDFELILPYAIKNFIPVGLMGILIAGLLAAFMSTFAATVNATPPYIINDIYKRYINPNADPKKYVRLMCVASISLVAIGVGFGFIVESINDVTLWIVGALWGGYAAANVLKWYWWRFNGYGFFWGMVSGIVAAMFVPKLMAVLFPNLNDLYGFPLILVFSTIGCIVGSLLTAPVEEKVLKKFYTLVRPWGFWKPIYEKVKLENPDFQKNNDFGRDCFNIIVGLIWQITLIALPMYIVIKQQAGIIYTAIALIISSIILKKNWLNKIK